MGPGFGFGNAELHRGYRPKRRQNSLADIEAEVISALDRANEVTTKAERKEAVRELKASARDFAAEAIQNAQYEALGRQLDGLLRLQMSAEKFLAQANMILNAQRMQEEDDLQAFMLLAELA